MESSLYRPLQSLSLGLPIVSPVLIGSPWKPDMALPACNLGAQEEESGGSQVQGHLRVHSKLETSQASVRPCLKTKLN